MCDYNFVTGCITDAGDLGVVIGPSAVLLTSNTVARTGRKLLTTRRSQSIVTICFKSGYWRVR